MRWMSLENNRVKLELLDLSNYKHLISIASQDKLIEYSPSDISNPEALRLYVQKAVDGYYHKTTIPFIVFDKVAGSYAGSSTFMNIDRTNKVLEIGSTWLGREFHGTGLNMHMKFLMLQYAFEDLKFEKVEFRIDERDLRSIKAVEKIGATLEGILRKNVYLKDGFKRNSCCYGILLEEWPDLKTSVFAEFN
ncbi:MAG: GNAT family N-acetyltransferase [Bacteroidia bacterium]|nr:GNAT family N-acetyltransferase [Bacteroidia bacterium]